MVELVSAGITNRFLAVLPSDVLERLGPLLELVELVPRRAIYDVGAPVTHVYFLNRGLVSLVKTMHDGRTVEIGAIGIDGMVGVFALHGIAPSIWECIVQSAGTAVRVKVEAVRSEMARSAAFRDLVQRYTHVFMSELAQNAACNRLHSLEERCCRWLLIAHDSALSDTFPLTHEYLALMLGVQRSGLSLTASVLQKAGLIRYTRGRVTVTDRRGLEAAACECHQAVRSRVDHLLSGWQP